MIVDFERTRRTASSHSGSPLLRSVCKDRQATLDVVDCTAGLGADSFVLAGDGHRVKMIERDPVFFALLRDGLHRAIGSACTKTRETAERLTLVHGDSIEILRAQASSTNFDVAYIDPMYPEGSVKRKSLPKKGMAAARVLMEEQSVDDELDIVKAALSAQIPRIVVKRPKRAPKSNGCSFSVAAAKTRYDVTLL